MGARGGPGASGVPGAQHHRAAHGHCPTALDPTWHLSCASPPYVAPGGHRHPRQHARHARACKHATRACTHTHRRPLPSTCLGTGPLQHCDTLTSETRGHMCVRAHRCPQAHLQGGTPGGSHSSTFMPAARTLVCTLCHKHTCSPQFPPRNDYRGLWVPPALWVPRLVASASLVPCHQVSPGVTSPAALSIPKGWLCPGSPEGGWRCPAHPGGDLVALNLCPL